MTDHFPADKRAPAAGDKDPMDRELTLRGDWTLPREFCPLCGAQLLVNRVDVKWCSAIGCAYVHSPFAAPGTLPSVAGSILTPEMVDIFAQNFDATAMMLHGGERRRARRDIAEQAFLALVATVRQLRAGPPDPDKDVGDADVEIFARAFYEPQHDDEVPWENFTVQAHERLRPLIAAALAAVSAARGARK